MLTPVAVVERVGAPASTVLAPTIKGAMNTRRDSADGFVGTPHSALVLAGGSAPTARQFSLLIEHATLPVRVIAADSGADHARSLGIDIDLVIGDFDSVSDATQAWLHRGDCEIRSFSPNKDLSDLELALEAAMETGPESLCVVGLGGGRPDHFMLNLVILADDRWASADVEGLADDCLISVVRNEITVTGEPGSLLTILPVAGPALVSTVGLLYPLDAEVLSPTAARGLSNVMESTEATVSVETGIILVMQPGQGRLGDLE